MNEIRLLLGKRIKELREKRDLTQQELAELVGIDQRNLSKIECGVTFPSRALGDIARALNINLPDLFDFEHIEVTPVQMKEFIRNSVNDLDDNYVTVLYRLIRTLHE